MIEDLAEQYPGLTVATIDADENEAAVSDFGVQSIPTMILFDRGQPVDVFAGTVPSPSWKGQSRSTPNPAAVHLDTAVVVGEIRSETLGRYHRVAGPVMWVVDRTTRNSQINWQFTTEDARIELSRLYALIDD